LIAAALTAALLLSAFMTPVAMAAEQDPNPDNQGVVIHVVEQVPQWVWYALAGFGGIALGGIMLAGVTARRARQTEADAAALLRRALTDPLTGALNRRGFDERMTAELARAKRTGRPLAVAYLDVVGLKAVNDGYGHATGDRLLQATGQLLAANSRAEDAFARIGGDEWAVILPDQDAEGAQTYARRLLARLPEARRELSVEIPWSLTVGWAVHPEDGEDGQELRAAADKRLYARRGIHLA
jgi:diguanylate cyclase (GGDEF)-like protein